MANPRGQRHAWIHQVGLVAFNYGIQRRSKDAGDLGVRLCLVWDALKDTDPDGLAEEEIRELSEVISELESVSKCSIWPLESDLPQRVRQNIESFLGGSKKDRRTNLVTKTGRLLQKLQAQEGSVQLFADPPKQAWDEYPDHIKIKLLLALRNQSRCSQCLSGAGDRSSSRWHPTRLLLKQGLQKGQDIASFDIVVSSDPIDFWQDIGLRIPLQAKRALRFADENSSPPIDPLEPEAAGFCHLLSYRTFARICFDFKEKQFVRVQDGFALQQRPSPGVGLSLRVVLQQYVLEVKDKISLAYIITSAFWQFYDTQILRHKWTSDSISFMPEEVGHTPRLSNKAYISIRFESGRKETDEYLDMDFLVHRFPRILSFAIILLEVGLGRSLQLRQFDGPVAQLNSDFEVATQALVELRELSWANFSNKDVYIKVIENCLQSTHYGIQQAANAATDTATLSLSDLNSRRSVEIDQRRRIFYNKVVWPLKWLAETGFQGNHDKVTFFSERTGPEPPALPPPTPRDEELMPMPSFHAGTMIDPHRWLDHLKQINQHVHRTLRNAPASSKGIRVAILDTGYDPSAPFFQDRARLSRVKGWKDFISASEAPVDTFGHGTFMATMLIEAAPVAELYIARVAEDTDKLIRRPSEVADAIRWAAIEKGADIISMSFGFPGTNEQIAKAIDEVRTSRAGKIIFLASAGNFGPYQDDTFPASHPAVIAFRATTSLGTFLDTNPINGNATSIAFGTYGDDIPQKLREYRPQVCQPGTSAATAIASGITAMILAYVTVLPMLVTWEDRVGLLLRAWTAEGMQKLFHRMSDDMGNRKRFLNPIKFFLDRPTDLARYCAIYDCLQGK
ncbi:peptidase S8/S53 domain-containing protein [Aspergillus californicus]